MKVAVIGPSKIYKIAQCSGIPIEIYKKYSKAVGQVLALLGLDLIIVPDQGVALHTLKSYKRNGGRKAICICPDDGTGGYRQKSNCKRNNYLCDEINEDTTWYHQHKKIGEIADVLVCIGLSCGTISEIAWTKWIKGTPVFVMRKSITSLPPEVKAEANIVLIDTVSDLKKRLISVCSKVKHSD